MIRSMTGYGRKEVSTPGIHATIEIRSVNNRFIDVQVKAPRSFAALEPRIRKAVQDRCSRGRIDVFITRSGERETAGKLDVDERLVSQYVGLMRNIKDRFGLQGEIDISLISGFPGLVTFVRRQGRYGDDLARSGGGAGAGPAGARWHADGGRERIGRRYAGASQYY